MRGVGEWGKQVGGESAETGDVGGVDGFVEADVFYGCSDDGTASVGAGGAGDNIDVRCADDEVEGKGGGQGDGEHLAFAGCHLDVGQVGGGGGPGSGAVDESVRRGGLPALSVDLERIVCLERTWRTGVLGRRSMVVWRTAASRAWRVGGDRGCARRGG